MQGVYLGQYTIMNLWMIESAAVTSFVSTLDDTVRFIV